MKKRIITPTGDDIFQIRANKNEGIALLTTQNEEHFLLLDSIDYWYDVIQNGYPPKKKCRCKNDFFKVECTYEPTKDQANIRHIGVNAICSVCEKTQSVLDLEIDYSPSKHLIDNPLTQVKNPNIKYKYKELFFYWEQLDFGVFFHFLDELKAHFYMQYWDKNRKDSIKELSVEEVLLQIEKDNYQRVFITKNPIDFSSYHKKIKGQYYYVTKDASRKQELLELKSPIAMGNSKKINRLYEMVFCTQYLQGEELRDKSADFQDFCQTIEKYIKKHKKKRENPDF